MELPLSIAITPLSTLMQSGSTSLGPIYRSNRCFQTIYIKKGYLISCNHMPRYMNLSTNFRGLLFRVEMAPS